VPGVGRAEIEKSHEAPKKGSNRAKQQLAFTKAVLSKSTSQLEIRRGGLTGETWLEKKQVGAKEKG